MWENSLQKERGRQVRRIRWEYFFWLVLIFTSCVPSAILTASRAAFFGSMHAAGPDQICEAPVRSFTGSAASPAPPFRFSSMVRKAAAAGLGSVLAVEAIQGRFD